MSEQKSPSKAKAPFNPFAQEMRAWWVERFLVRHYTGEVSIYTGKKPLKVTTFAPTESILVGMAPKAPSLPHSIHPAFRNLGALEAKYRDPTLSKEDRKKLVKALWPLVDRLIRERRIVIGTLGNPPMEAGGTFQEIRDALLEMSFFLDAIRFELSILRAEAERKGWRT